MSGGEWMCANCGTRNTDANLHCGRCGVLRLVPTPATPEATEREAREGIEAGLNALSVFGGKGALYRDKPKVAAMIDRYRAAVAAVEYERGRRAERERIEQIVEEMRKQSADTVRAIGRAWAGEQQASANALVGVNSPHLASLADRCHDAPLAALLDRLREGA